MHSLIKSSIRNKILFIALVGGLGLIINISFTHTVVKDNSYRLKKISDVYFPIIEKADACVTFLDKITKAFSESISAGETIFIDSAEVAKEDMHRSLNSIATISPDNEGAVQKLKDEFNAYYTSNKKLAEGLISGELQSISLKNAVENKNISMGIFENSLLLFRDNKLQTFSSIINETDLASKNSLDIGIIIFMIVGWVLAFSTLAVTTTIRDSFGNVIDSLNNMAKGKIDNHSQINPDLSNKNNAPKELTDVRNALSSVTKRFLETENEILDLNQSLQDKVYAATDELQTVNKKLEEAVNLANQANQAKSTFLANMSHELRTPMNAIIGYGELLEEDIKNEEYQDMVSDIRKVRTASKHLLSLISDILDLSKIEAGKMEFSPKPFSLKQLTEEIEDTIQPLILEGNNTYTVETQTDSIEMFSDLTKLKQILLNLLSNACKFTKEGEIRLLISSHSQNQIEYLHFEVSDTGIGVASDKITTLFDSFTQVDSTTTKKFGGTGLGLAISRRYAQMMGGDIQAESEENIGSRFVVIMPVNFIAEKIA